LRKDTHDSYFVQFHYIEHCMQESKIIVNIIQVHLRINRNRWSGAICGGQEK